MDFVETQTIGKVRNRVSHSVVLVLLWFLTTARPSWVCGGWNDVNSRPQFFGKFSKIHTFSEWLCFDAHYCNILVWILVWKKNILLYLHSEWNDPKQLVWMEMGVFIARVFGMVSLDKTPQTTLLLGNTQCMHGAFSGAVSNDLENIFQPLQKSVQKTVLQGHLCLQQVSTGCFHVAYLQMIGLIPQ